MKATGIVRRIDDLGRIVIPKEIRRTIRIREGDPMEIFLENGAVVFKKYSPIGELTQLAADYADCANATLGCTVLVSDTDDIVAVSGAPRREFIEQILSKDVEEFIFNKRTKLFNGADTLPVTRLGSLGEYVSQIIAPIVSQGDVIGAVILISTANEFSDLEFKSAELGAKLLARQMEG